MLTHDKNSDTNLMLNSASRKAEVDLLQTTVRLQSELEQAIIANRIMESPLKRDVCKKKLPTGGRRLD